MAVPKKRTYRGMRALDANPIVTYDSTKPHTLSVKLSTDTGVFDFRMDREKADRLRYLLGRALDPASEPPRYLSS